MEMHTAKSSSILLAAAVLMTALPAFADVPQLPAGGCDKARCLALGVETDALDGLPSEPLETLVAALRYLHRGDGPLAARFVAMRYQNGRLVRYRASGRLELAPAENAALEAARDAILGALGPVTEREVRVSAPRETAVPAPVVAEVFVGSLPPTYLASEEFADRSLLARLPAESASFDAAGAVGVLVLLPEDREQRASDVLESSALLVQLDPVVR